MASGCLLFDDSGRLLVVKPTYSECWLIPGGVVENEESPLEACKREVKEEIGLVREIADLACVDYTSTKGEHSESIQFIFWGGMLSEDEIERIKLPPSELEEFRFVETEGALTILNERLSRRVRQCLTSLKEGAVLYLEDQLPICS